MSTQQREKNTMGANAGAAMTEAKAEAKDVVAKTTDAVKDAAANVAHKAADAGSYIAHKAEGATSAVGGEMKSLAGTIRDIDAAFDAARRLKVGGVMINDTSSYHADAMPYGGVKDSGYGLEGPKYAVQDMTDPRIIVLNLRAPAEEAGPA